MFISHALDNEGMMELGSGPVTSFGSVSSLYVSAEVAAGGKGGGGLLDVYRGFLCGGEVGLDGRSSWDKSFLDLLVRELDGAFCFLLLLFGLDAALSCRAPPTAFFRYIILLDTRLWVEEVEEAEQQTLTPT